MARDRANIRIDMWADMDVRKLSLGAQHLYMMILTHSTLNYAGVADWRPGRYAALTANRTRADVEADAQELQQAHFIYTDEDTEEVMVRSFLRHDGVIKHPRLHVSMAKDYAGISSTEICAFVAFELQKLHKEQPTLALWADLRVQTILKSEAKDLKELSQSFPIALPEPLANPLAKDLNSVSKDTSTATSTPTSNEVGGVNSPPQPRGQSGTRIPANFTATPEMIRWALDNAPNVNTKASTQKFKAHYRSVSGPQQFKTDWVAAWESWLLSDQQRATDKPQQFKTGAEKRLEQGRANHDLFAQMDAERANAAKEITQ